MKQTILERAMELEADGVKIRRTLHEHPEIGFELPKTLDLVMAELKAYGYQPERIGKAGIMASVGQGGKTFLLRADMDALPMKEETGLPYASCNDYMHACGHDFHTSALLLAARILKEREAELPGTVRLMFQPCEEAMGGAVDMVAAGILKEPVPDAAMALHVLHDQAGSVGYSPGAACASSDIFTIQIKGQGGHGAAPHLGVDPINAAVHIQLALQAINSREVHPDQMVVCSICQIHSGTASNIFPDTAMMQGTIRTMNSEVRAFVKERLVQIVKTTAQAFRAEAEVIFLNDGAPPMINDNALLTNATAYIDEMMGAGTCREIPRMTGSEDFSVISERVPSVLFWVGTGSTEEGYPYGVHDSRVTFDERMIPKLAAIYGEVAFRWLQSNS